MSSDFQCQKKKLKNTKSVTFSQNYSSDCSPKWTNNSPKSKKSFSNSNFLKKTKKLLENKFASDKNIEEPDEPLTKIPIFAFENGNKSPKNLSDDLIISNIPSYDSSEKEIEQLHTSNSKFKIYNGGPTTRNDNKKLTKDLEISEISFLEESSQGKILNTKDYQTYFNITNLFLIKKFYKKLKYLFRIIGFFLACKILVS